MASPAAILSDEHYRVFGGIIVGFAKAEIGIKMTLAGLLKIDLLDALAITAPYGSVSLRNVAKSIAKLKWEDRPELLAEFLHLVGKIKGRATMRNDIAHNLWRVGRRPSSIAPMYVSVREDRADLIGLGEEHRDYLLDEFSDAAVELNDMNMLLSAFWEKAGLAAIIRAKTEVSSTSSS